jgi:hypothetical protein
MKTYTTKELQKKYKNTFIYVRPHHFEYWNDETNKYETVYEVIGTSRIEKENFQTVQAIIGG